MKVLEAIANWYTDTNAAFVIVISLVALRRLRKRNNFMHVKGYQSISRN